MSEINGDLLRDVANEIWLDETAFHMQSWVSIPGGFNAVKQALDNEELCGSTCCVAGWTVRMQNLEVFKKLALLDWMQIHAYGTSSHELVELRKRLEKEFEDEYGVWISAELWPIIAARYLNMDMEDAMWLFDGGHGPKNELTAAQALEKIAAGTPMREVWGPEYDDCDCENCTQDLEDLYIDEEETYY